MESNNEILDANIEERFYDIGDQYLISTGKFILLSIVTFGLYDLWWTYKAWCFYKEREKSDIMPEARAIFGIFFLVSLFDRILASAKDKGYNESYSSIGLFIAFLITNGLSRLPYFWIISVLGVLFLIPPFKAFNYARAKATDCKVIYQDTFSGRQIALLVIGAILWVLIAASVVIEL